MPAKKRKPMGIRGLDAKLRAIIQRYVRVKAAKDAKCDEVPCVTCGAVKNYNKLQGGHFFKSKTYPKYRFELWNINPCCYNCNINNEGNLIPYFIYMEKKHGREQLDKWIAESKGSVKRSIEWYKEQIEIWQERLLEIENIQ